MKTLSFLVIALMFLVCRPVLAQDSLRAKRIEYVLGASLVYSLADYYGFNQLIRRDNLQPGIYYAIKATLQFGLSYFLYKTCGLSSAISFNLIWWTWGDDVAYYGWSYVANSFPWEDRTENGFRFRSMSWAGWTPLGLTKPQGSWIARDALITQAVIGLGVSIGILW